MSKIEGKYKVYYKNPRQDITRQRRFLDISINTFEGVCENFTTHLSAFRNDKGELLIVDYEDIIQLKPIQE